MKYLDRERRRNLELIREFDEQFRIIVQEMIEVYERKGEDREACSATPIHHHSGPSDMVREIQTKGRRLKGMLDYAGWWNNEHRLSNVVEEAVDIANYALFLATLSRMRIHDLELYEMRESMEESLVRHTFGGEVALYSGSDQEGEEDEHSTD